MKLKELLSGVGLIFTAAVGIGTFAAVVTRVYHGGGLTYIALALACFAAAWVAGKIPSRKNKDTV